jgi:hypothetical protein
MTTVSSPVATTPRTQLTTDWTPVAVSEPSVPASASVTDVAPAERAAEPDVTASARNWTRAMTSEMTAEMPSTVLGSRRM